MLKFIPVACSYGKYFKDLENLLQKNRNTKHEGYVHFLFVPAQVLQGRLNRLQADSGIFKNRLRTEPPTVSDM
jgi:hypothetical protein